MKIQQEPEMESTEAIMTKVQFRMINCSTPAREDKFIESNPDLRIEYLRSCDRKENKFGIALAYCLGFHPYLTSEGKVWLAEKGESSEEGRIGAWIEHFKQRFFEDLNNYGLNRPTEEFEEYLED